jgi:hypothetical protein
MIQKYTGLDSDYFLIGFGVILLIFLVLLIIQTVRIGKLNKRLNNFLKGKDGKSLEDTLIHRLDQIDDVSRQNEENKRNIKKINARLKNTFCRYGIVKYDAFNESGGKLSFVITLLDEKKDGYILNVVHAHDGSYSYVKDVVAGNPIVNLGTEEEECLEKALTAEIDK